MNATLLTPLAIGALLLAGCAAGADAISPTTAVPEPPAAAVVEATPAAPSAKPPVVPLVESEPEPAPTSCFDFQMTASHIATYWQYLTINVGTDNDPQPTLEDLKAGMTAMQDLAPKCAPKATDSLDDLAATVDELTAVYTTRPVGMEVETVNDALDAMQSQAIKTWKKLDIAPVAWE